MPTATITVRYADPPREGRRMASIKDVNNVLYFLYPEKLSEFQVNGIYDIQYEESQSERGTFRKIVSGAKKGEAPRPMGGGRGPMAPRETSQRDAERMFVCSLLNAAIQAGKLDLNANAVSAAVNAMRSAWAETFGAETKIQVSNGTGGGQSASIGTLSTSGQRMGSPGFGGQHSGGNQVSRTIPDDDGSWQYDTR